jgi:hypothetical protein
MDIKREGKPNEEQSQSIAGEAQRSESLGSS